METPASKGEMSTIFTCQECHHIFPSETFLMKHLIEHNQQKAFITAPPHESSVQVPPPPPSPMLNTSTNGARGNAGFAPGTVAYYNDVGGYGFIKRTTPAVSIIQVYFRISACNIQTPKPSLGERIFFTEKQGHKGPMATAVVRTITATGFGHEPSAGNIGQGVPSSNSSTHISAQGSHGALLVPGIVMSYEAVGGFGTIQKTGASGGGFVHFQVSVCDIRRPPPTQGEQVKLVEVMGTKGPTAKLVYRGAINASSASAGAKKPRAAASQGKNKAAAKGRRSHTQDELIAALTRAMCAMSAMSSRNSPRPSSTPEPRNQTPPVPEQTQSTSQAPLRAAHYKIIIDLLNRSEFSLYLPSALGILRRTHQLEASNIEQLDGDTQREMLLILLQEEFEEVQRREIAVEWGSEDFLYTEVRSPTSHPQIPTSPSPEPELPRTAHCEICKDDEPLEDMFFVSGCNHAYCRDSMRSFVLGRMELQDITPTCPFDGCDVVISDADISMVLTVEEQEQFYNMSIDLAVTSIPGVFKCFTENCRGIIDLARDDPHFVCPLCHSERCIACNTRVWHDGVTCEQHQQRERDSELHPEQVQGMFGAGESYQCGSCGFGPILRSGCSNLQTHQGEAVGNGRVSNNCPQCGWFAADIAAWPRWNGRLWGRVN